MRIALAVVLAVVGVYAGWFAYGVLQYLWADYKDSPTSTYLLFGLPPLALCIAALISAAILIRRT
jgi:hypothetical protein